MVRQPVDVERDRGQICRAVLERLPEWFGRRAALDAYVMGADDMPMLASFTEDGAPAGFVSLNDQTAFATEVYVMGVVPDLHRYGIGGGLIEAAAGQAKARGACFLTVKTLAPAHPDPNYAATRRFYEAMGFLPLETLPTLWGEGTPCLMMIRPVTEAPCETDAAEVEKLERWLLQPDARASADVVASILADDFQEFGGSGRVYDKQATIAGTLWFNIEDGRLRLSQGTGEHSDQSPQVRSSPQTPGLTFANRRCRYHLALTIKVPKDGGWTAVAEPPPPPAPPAPIGPVIHLKAGESFELVAAPSPQELIPLPQTSGTGQRLPEELKGHCPHLSGMVYFEPRDVFSEMPWKADPPMTPGLVRDPEARATTLIFQSAACRDEIRVTREIEHNGVWQPSLLSADPKGTAP